MIINIHSFLFSQYWPFLYSVCEAISIFRKTNGKKRLKLEGNMFERFYVVCRKTVSLIKVRCPRNTLHHLHTVSVSCLGPVQQLQHEIISSTSASWAAHLLQPDGLMPTPFQQCTRSLSLLSKVVSFLSLSFISFTWSDSWQADVKQSWTGHQLLAMRD